MLCTTVYTARNVSASSGLAKTLINAIKHLKALWQFVWMCVCECVCVCVGVFAVH